MRLITDIFQYCASDVPSWNTISISGYHIREAGSTAVQEVAFTLANGIAYVEAALAAGLNIDDFAGQLSFFFNAHNNFLEEVAKFRAARRLWAKIMRERFKAQKPSSWQMRFHTQTAGSTLTAQQPENNVVRVTVQALSAVLGGTQSLHTNSMDEALWLPTEKAVRVQGLRRIEKQLLRRTCQNDLGIAQVERDVALTRQLRSQPVGDGLRALEGLGEQDPSPAAIDRDVAADPLAELAGRPPQLRREAIRSTSSGCGVDWFGCAT
jgi:methylmalonyl-CoA mutase cobalamin-binding domain/chain